MDPENLEVSGPPLGAGTSPPSWYTQAPEPLCSISITQMWLKLLPQGNVRPLQGGRIFLLTRSLLKVVSECWALFLEHLLGGQKEIRLTQVHVRIISGLHGPKDRIRGKVQGRLARGRGGQKRPEGQSGPQGADHHPCWPFIHLEAGDEIYENDPFLSVPQIKILLQDCLK